MKISKGMYIFNDAMRIVVASWNKLSEHLYFHNICSRSMIHKSIRCRINFTTSKILGSKTDENKMKRNDGTCNIIHIHGLKCTTLHWHRNSNSYTSLYAVRLTLWNRAFHFRIHDGHKLQTRASSSVFDKRNQRLHYIQNV